MGAQGLIQQIKSRTVGDIINQGYRAGLTGTVGTVTNSIVYPSNSQRIIVVTGVVITTNSSTDVLVSLNFSSNGTPFFQGYVKTGMCLAMEYSLGDERYSAPEDALWITTTGGTVAYTINARIISMQDAVVKTF